MPSRTGDPRLAAAAFIDRELAFAISCIARTPHSEQLPAQIEWVTRHPDAMATCGNGVCT
jgi:hypothetical protein